MSRPGNDPVFVKPQPDVFTALLAVALVATLVSLIILFMRYNTLFPNNPIWS